MARSALPFSQSTEWTYVPVDWDFSDVAETVRALWPDAERRAHIAESASARVRFYLSLGACVDDVAALVSSVLQPIAGRSDQPKAA